MAISGLSTEQCERVHETDFECIFEAYYKRVYNYVYYRVSSREVCEDLTSCIFEKIFVKFNTYEEEKTKFEVWLFAVARNVVNDYYRSLKKFKWAPFDAILEIISFDKSPEEYIISKETNDNVLKAINILKRNERDIIAYKFGAEIKNKEIAQLLGMSESNVGVSIHRILKKLKCEMEKI